MEKDHKSSVIQIRVTPEKHKELQAWAKKFGVKLGPWCLCIIMEKLHILGKHWPKDEPPDIPQNSKKPKESF